jgi:hypothetical protein
MSHAGQKPGFRVFACAVAVALSSELGADSPLTSTDLATAYGELAAVRRAREAGHLEGDVLAFLVGDHPTDQKAAVVNALGWKTPGNALAFVRGIAQARGVDPADLKLAQLTAADRFVLGYLRALETYSKPAPLKAGGLDLWGASPFLLLDEAAQALPGDFVVHYVRSLVEAQRAMGDSFCSAYIVTHGVLDSFPPKKRNLRPNALAAAQGYMEAYKGDCAKAPMTTPKAGAPAPLTAEHEQVYSLARLGDTIVAGTQAGVVVWGRDRRRPIASRDQRICARVVVWQESAWAGCYGSVVRWDGKAWKAYLQDPGGADDAYTPLVGSGGRLLVWRGPSAWEYDPAADRFLPTALVTGTAWDRVPFFRRSGDLLWRESLKAPVGPQRRYKVASADYPGRDPGNLIEDSEGRLWVADFKDGFYRLDEATGRFVREEGVDGQGIAVAVDNARERVWFLHYRVGLLLKTMSGVETIDLHDLQYMRDMLLDDRTGDVWVAGWPGIARLQSSGKGWKREDWRVSLPLHP